MHAYIHRRPDGLPVLELLEMDERDMKRLHDLMVSNDLTSEDFRSKRWKAKAHLVEMDSIKGYAKIQMGGEGWVQFVRILEDLFCVPANMLE